MARRFKCIEKHINYFDIFLARKFKLSEEIPLKHKFAKIQIIWKLMQKIWINFWRENSNNFTETSNHMIFWRKNSNILIISFHIFAQKFKSDFLGHILKHCIKMSLMDESMESFKLAYYCVSLVYAEKLRKVPSPRLSYIHIRPCGS